MVISGETVILIGDEGLSCRCPKEMEKNGDDIMVTVKWAQNILTFLNWVKRRGTTAKRDESSIALRADLLLLESKNSKITGY